MTTEVFQFRTQRSRHGRITLHEGAVPSPAPAPLHPANNPGNPCRIARLVAMAHQLNHLVRSGLVADYADAGRLETLSRARVSQIANLLLLAPAIQERLLFLTRPATGREPIGERDLRSICLEPDWERQQVMFDRLLEVKGITAR